ncbi:hypothetical protein FRB91_003592 [Serendipita sp. 411]|nr:hypothetical protein FRB91_003592 [Serendipita sp. 411]
MKPRLLKRTVLMDQPLIPTINSPIRTLHTILLHLGRRQSEQNLQPHAGRNRSKTIAALPRPPSSASSVQNGSTSSVRKGSSSSVIIGSSRPPSAIQRSSSNLTHPSILHRIFALAADTAQSSSDPFFHSAAATNKWYASLLLLKRLCLVSKDWHALATPILYGCIRVRRIPQLAALVSTLAYRSQHKPSWTNKTYGSHTRELDLSFYIPPEWNNLYADDVRRLLSFLPNLQTYRSRPILAIVGPRAVPSAILITLAETRNELLSELELSEQEGPQMPDLIRLLQTCTYLEKLVLGKHVFDGGLGNNTPALRLPSLRVLDIQVTNRPTPGSFASLPSPHVLQEAAKWDLPNIEELNLVLHDDITKLPFAALNPFLNIHGHKLRQLTLRDVNPLMRSTPLSVSNILSRCPNLESLSVVASSTVPLMLARPHVSLRSIRFMGVAPGSKRDIGGEVGLGHLLALQADNVEAREKLPVLDEVIIQGEEDPVELQALRFLWEDTLGARGESGLKVVCVNQEGEVMHPHNTAFMASISSSGANRAVWDNLGEVEEGDDDEWLPDDDEEGDEEEEEAELEAMGEDDEKSDDETVRDSRSGRGRDDDQVDHTTALLIFQDSRLRRSRPPVLQFSGPEGWTMGSRPAHTDSEAKPNGVMAPREMVNGWASNSLNLNGLSGNEGATSGPLLSQASASLRQSAAPGGGAPSVVSAGRHGTGGSARGGSVDFKRHSLGPGSLSKLW